MREVVGVLLGCAVLLVLLAKLDRAGYEHSMARARKAIAAQQAAAAKAGPVDEPAATRTVRPPEPRTESLSDRGPIVLPVGGAWSAGTAVTVPDVTHTVTHTAPEPSIRRILGPDVPDVGTVSDAAATEAAPLPPVATPAAARPAPTPGHHRMDGVMLLVLLLAGTGVVLVVTGATLVVRAR